MATPHTAYTEEHGATIVELLAQGRRVGSCAKAVGMCRDTLYTWRHENPEFAAAWDGAVAEATDRLEEVLYSMALGGDQWAVGFWLKHNRPHPYDRTTMIKLGILQASLAAAQASGNGRLVIDLGPDGMPLLPPPNGSGDPLPLRSDELIAVVAIPHNGREELPPSPPVDDGSGRTYPLPRRAMAILHDGVCVQLTADSAIVPSGAIPVLWERIQLHNKLAHLSQPLDTSRNRAAELRLIEGEELT